MIRLKSLLVEGSKLKDGATSRGLSVAKQLKSRLGLTAFQAAAIVGNFIEESGVRADAQQDMTGAGKYISGPLKADGRTGYSFAQWTEKGRQQSLQKFAKSRDLDITKEHLTSAIAIDFVVNEFNGTFSNVLKKLKASKTLSAATNIILKQYEMPANQGATALANRTANAQAILDLMGETKKTSTKAAASKSTTTNKKTKAVQDITLMGTIDYVSQKLGQSSKPKAVTTAAKSATSTSQYTVKSGDTLSGIATKYKTTVPNIKKLNKLTTDMIKPGQKLKIK